MSEFSESRQRRYERRKSAERADIGEIPPVANPERRESCRDSLFLFLTTYFPQSTGLKPLSDAHRRVIDRMQGCVETGDLFINALPRGFAKTTISENTAIWATIYGHRKFVPVFGSDANAASGIIESIKLELSENDLLYEDFPEVCHPIRALEGKPQRCLSQTYQGELTYIGWRADEIVLPTIPGSEASGAILTARGLTGASRGMKHKRPDGTQQRPDFAIIDDPQTDESASTPLQVQKRLDTIRKSILKLGGHNRKIGVVINATVIRRGDLIERMLNRKEFPAWQGERIKMVQKWADAHDTLWLTDYAARRNNYNPDILGDQQRAHREATEFYRANREAMDAGAVVTWEHCYDAITELSAIQHAYNALIDDGEEVFASEYQNEPLEQKVEDDDLRLRPEQVMAKANGLARGDVPVHVSRIVAFIDPKKDLLFWTVVGFADGFTSWVLDYGTFPDQRKPYFSSRKPRFSLQRKGEAWESALYAALDALTNQICGRQWKRDDGALLRTERVLIDHGWGDATQTIDLFCRQSAYAGIVSPSKGIYCGAKSRPFNDREARPGERRGAGWRIMPAMGRHAVRPVQFDTNYWKSFVANRVKTPMGGRGCLSIWGHDQRAHQLFADHMCAETPIAVEAAGRRVVEWRDPMPGVDNDFFDCVVGCHVAAAERGVTLHEVSQSARTRMSLADMRKRARHWDSSQRKWVTRNG